MIDKKHVKTYCCEDISNIENYEEAVSSPEKWVCHHRMETHRRNGKERVTRLSTQDLIDWGIYYNRPADELVFMTRSEHSRLHTKDNICSPEVRLRPNKGKFKNGHRCYLKHHSEETKRKLSEAMKGHKVSEETREKYRQAHLGKNFTCNAAYKEYKANGGTLTWNEFQREFKR